MIFEEYLIFPARKYPQGLWDYPLDTKEDVWFTSADGTRLHGWYFPHESPRGYLLYCHGNGNNVSELGGFAESMRERYELSVLVFDYRGYGRSDGRPNESGVLADGESALEWLAQREDVPTSSIMLMGRSLGGAVAVHLASHKPVRALVLHSTFCSLPEVAKHHYPWLPVRIFMRNRFRSDKKLPHCGCPLLQFHGDADEVVPFRCGQRLFQAAQTANKMFVVLRGERHNAPLNSEFHAAFAAFLDELPDCSGTLGFATELGERAELLEELTSPDVAGPDVRESRTVER